MTNSKFKNPGPIELDTVIEREEGVPNSSAWISFPFDLKVTYGKGNLVPVIATFDGRVKYQGSLAKMGTPHACLILRKDVREQLGKEPGDKVHVVIELDTSARKISFPTQVRDMLKQSGQWDTLQKLSFSHQREYYMWITEAKRAETRAARIAKMSEMLANGVKTPK